MKRLMKVFAMLVLNFGSSQGKLIQFVEVFRALGYFWSAFSNLHPTNLFVAVKSVQMTKNNQSGI